MQIIFVIALILSACSKSTTAIVVVADAKQHCDWVECINDIHNMPDCQQLSADLNAEEMAEIFFRSKKALVRYSCGPKASVLKPR